MMTTVKLSVRGRPPTSKVIAFSEQPVSIVSQLLRQQKQDANNSETLKKFNNNGDKKSISEAIQIIIDSDSSDSLDNSSEIINSKEMSDSPEKAQFSEHESFVYIHKEKEVRCQICLHRSTNSREHKAHLLTHKVNGQFSCDSCSYKSNLSCNLIKHVRVHRADKPFLCDECTFRSNFINSLKAHKRIHSGERPYSCSQCDYYCNSISNLKKHTLHRHSESQLKTTF